MHRRMVGQKPRHSLGLMSRKIVGNDVNLAILGLRGQDLTQERDKLFRGVPLRRFSQNLATAGLQSRVERERTVPAIFEPMPLYAAGRERQDRIETVQGLNRRFLVHTENGRMLRRVHIETDNIRRLLLEVGM